MKKWIRGFLTLLLALSLAASGTTSYADQSEVDGLKDELEQAKNKTKDISNQKKAVEDAKDQLEDQADSLSGQISSLNSQISAVSGQISDTEEDITKVQADIEMLNEELSDTQADLDSQKESMKLRIQYMYENQSTNTIVNLLESGSFAEFLQRIEYMSQITKYDETAVQKFEETEAALEDTKTQIDAKYEELTAYQDTLEGQKNELGGLVSSTTSALNTTNAQIETSAAALKELEQQLKEAEEYEATIQRKIDEAQNKMAENMGGAGNAERYSGGYAYTEDEVQLLAALIQAEADNQGDAGRKAVASVVMNRVIDSRFSGSIGGVIYANNQFAPVASGRVTMILAAGPHSWCVSAAQSVLDGGATTNARFFCTYSYATALDATQTAEGKEGFLSRTDGVVINAHYFYNYK